MLSEELVDVDPELAESMSKIEWHDITRAEASSFGLSVGLVRDASASLERTHCLVTSYRTVIMSCVLVVCVGAFLGLKPAGLLVAILAILLVSFIGAIISRNRARKHAALQKMTLNTEVDRLASRHPQHVQSHADE